MIKTLKRVLYFLDNILRIYHDYMHSRDKAIQNLLDSDAVDINIDNMSDKEIEKVLKKETNFYEL